MDLLSVFCIPGDPETPSGGEYQYLQIQGSEVWSPCTLQVIPMPGKI